ncbi:hypothetical protein AHAS_Ahas01G0189200 [Arachis hypogaea]
MDDQPPPTPYELFRMITELQQANQCMAKENQRMPNQITELTNARVENNDNHNEQPKDDEENSNPTHISKTQESERDQQNDEDDELDNTVGPFTADVMNFKLPRNFVLPITLTIYNDMGDPKKYVKKFRSMMIVNGASDPILCHYFSTFLVDLTLDWFSSFPAGKAARKLKGVSHPLHQSSNEHPKSSL